MINKVAEDLGRIYGLVNHCPGPKAGIFEALTEADWRTAIRSACTATPPPSVRRFRT